MKNLKMRFYVVATAIAVFTGTSCSTNNTKTDDQEVKAMDSVSSELAKSEKELDEQAKKVEASLEKMDQELNTSK